jgi:dUTP pyrophosphatase
MVQVMNRSSIASKKQLVVGAHCVDSGYDGEIFIDIHNVGSTTRTLQPGDKIAQLVMVPVVHFRMREATELYDEPITISNRGDGALGSTDG